MHKKREFIKIEKEGYMKVLEIRLNIFILKDIISRDIQEKLSELIDKSFLKDQYLKELHKKNNFKNYCFDLPYPIEKDKIYHKNVIYSFRIRTINIELAKHFSDVLVNEYTDYIKILNSEVKIIPRKYIEKIYTLTPIVIKDKNGYWKKNLSLKDFEKRLFVNLIKKYKNATGMELNEDFILYKKIEFMNKKPISINYKNIKLLGDKISLEIENNKEAQELAYLAIGCGILENNARGLGFVNFRYL